LAQFSREWRERLRSGPVQPPELDKAFLCARCESEPPTACVGAKASQRSPLHGVSRYASIDSGYTRDRPREDASRLGRAPASPLLSPPSSEQSRGENPCTIRRAEGRRKRDPDEVTGVTAAARCSPWRPLAISHRGQS
jgi:hypothetical protein